MALELSEDASLVEERLVLFRSGRRYSLWEVRVASDAVGQSSWWVAHPLLSLFSAADFPSAEAAFKQFLGGLVYGSSDSVPHDNGAFSEAWRRWRDAVALLDEAMEAETVQSVGMRCRECLLSLANEAARPAFVDANQEAPQRSNFPAWAELIVTGLCRGDRFSRHRKLMRETAIDTWQFVNWLTHARGAVQADGQVAVDATELILRLFTAATGRYQQEQTEDRCPKCNSYRLTVEFRPEGDPYHYDDPSVIVCEACGWEYRPPNQEPKLPRLLPRREEGDPHDGD